MPFFAIWIVQSVVTCKSGRAPSCKSVCFGISKLVLYFPYYFHVPCTVLFTVYFRTVISMLRFLCYWSHSKVNAVNQTIQLFLTKDLPSISQSNVQAVTAKNECNIPWVTWYTLNYKIIAFFSLRSILKEVLVKCTQTN